MASPPDPASLDRPWIASYPPGVPPTYRLPDVGLPRLLDDAVRDFPEQDALVVGRAAWTFAEFRGHVDRLEQVFQQQGITRGDRVLVTLPTGTSLLVVLMALWRRAAVPMPVPDDADAGQLAAVSAESDVVAVVGTPESVARLAGQDGVPRLSISVSGDEWESRGRRRRPGLRPYRSWRRGRRRPRAARPGPQPPASAGANSEGSRQGVGTRRLRELLAEASAAGPDAPATGVGPFEDGVLEGEGPAANGPALVAVGLHPDGPSAVEHTHRTLIATAFQSRLWLPDVQAGRERMLIAEPLHDIVGLAIGFLSALLSGATTILPPDPSPGQVTKVIERQRPTLLVARSDRMARLFGVPDGGKGDLTSLRVCLAVGDPLPPSTAHALEQRSSGARVRAICGCGDAAPITHGQPVYGRTVPSAAGLPVTDTLAVVVDPEDLGTPCAAGETGLLLIRGPQVPDVGAMCVDGRTVNGWLVTQDLARMDDDGWFTILGHRDELLARGADPVPAHRISASLRRRGDVQDAVVVRVGQRAVAAVVGARRRMPQPDDLLDDLAAEFGPRGLPDRIVVVSELPRTSDGEVDRAELSDQLLGWLEPGDRSLPRPATSDSSAQRNIGRGSVAADPTAPGWSAVDQAADHPDEGTRA